MIKKLRLKFIISAMVALTIVMIAIVVGINFRGWIQIKSQAINTLNVLIQNDGNLPTPVNGAISQNQQYREMMSSWYTVEFLPNGQYAVNTTQDMSMTADKAISRATTLKNANKTSGFDDKEMYQSFTNKNSNLMYVFVDCSSSLMNFNITLRSSIMIGISGLCAVLILVIILSYITMKPVEETYKKQKQFITDANHELKTPLTVIDANCEILEYNTGENEWTKGIKEQVSRLTDLTNKLVFLSKMDEERKWQMTDFSLSELAEITVQDYVLMATNQNKKFEYNIDKNITLKGDTSMVRKMFTLLLDNAFKYSDKEGNIKFDVTNKNGIKIILSNTTDGVPKGNLDKLFERFYRLDSSRNSDTGGHGIGLSVVQAIAELHKGKATCYSPDGKLIIFTISIK